MTLLGKDMTILLMLLKKKKKKRGGSSLRKLQKRDTDDGLIQKAHAPGYEP